MTPIWSTVVAVLGTLAGALIVGGLQARLAHTARRDTHTIARHTEVLAAVTALMSALADHRRAMWVREDLRLSDADPDRIADARATSHETRSRITAPLVTVVILLPDLAPLARRAATATYAMRHAPNPTTLATLHDTAITTADRLLNAATRTIANITTTIGGTHATTAGTTDRDRPGDPR